MLTSPTFWLVLLVAVPVYWAVPQRARPGFLGLVSMGYLATLSWQSVAMLAFWALVFYWIAPKTVAGRPGRARVLWGLVLGIAAFFSAFKYLPELIGEAFGGGLTGRVAIPLGISYYSFKLIHYAVEVARGTVPSRSFGQFVCFLFLVPIFTAGPIQRFDLFLKGQEARWSSALAVEGLARILYGLIKKFVFAWYVSERLFDGNIADENLAFTIAHLTPGMTLLYLAGAYLYIYFDFSAYTDMAIGTSRLFGLRIMENFNFPLVAANIRDYWRRWHISLSAWCQSYVYLPLLGLYRKPLVSLYATFFVMGVWHNDTVNRLLWGLYHATGVAVFTAWSRWRMRRGVKLPRWIEVPFAVALTQLFVCGSMAFLLLEDQKGLAGAAQLFAQLANLD